MAQRQADNIMSLVTSLRVAHDHCPSDVFWPTPHQDESDRAHRARSDNRGHHGWCPRHDHGEGGGGSGHGGSHRRSGGGGSSGGGRSRDRTSHRRTGGRGDDSGGGDHSRRSGPVGKGSRGKGKQAPPRATVTKGIGATLLGGAYRAGGSSSSEDRSKSPAITAVSGKRQEVPSLVDVASSAELRSRLSICQARFI